MTILVLKRHRSSDYIDDHENVCVCPLLFTFIFMFMFMFIVLVSGRSPSVKMKISKRFELAPFFSFCLALSCLFFLFFPLNLIRLKEGHSCMCIHVGIIAIAVCALVCNSVCLFFFFFLFVCFLWVVVVC